MLLPNSLSKEDLKRAFDYLEGLDDTAVQRIRANPVLESSLFEANLGVPIEYDESEIGVVVFGLDRSTNEVEELKFRFFCGEDFEQFKQIVACCGDRKEPDGNLVRIWAFEDAPSCLKQISEHGGDEEWVVLIPPNLFGRYIKWFESSAMGHDKDVFMLPGGWQIAITAH